MLGKTFNFMWCTLCEHALYSINRTMRLAVCVYFRMFTFLVHNLCQYSNHVAPCSSCVFSICIIFFIILLRYFNYMHLIFLPAT